MGDTASGHRLSSATQGHTYKVHCSITWTRPQRTFAAPFQVAHPQLALPLKRLPSTTQPCQLNLSCLGRPIPTAGLAA
eukprot:scaffold6563_cov70-Phaeocystis_antarctica.AAC.4